MKKNLVEALLFCFSSIALGTNYYVSPTGDDANSGSEFLPFQTVNAALQVADGGDTILLTEGVYREMIDLANYSGATSNSATLQLKAVDGDNVIIDGTDVISGTWSAEGNGIYSINFPTEVSQLFISENSEPTQCIIARWPNVTANINDPFKHPHSKVDANFTYNNYETELTNPPSTFNDSQLSTLSNTDISGAKVWMMPGTSWFNITEVVDSATNSSITFTGRYTGFIPSQGFYPKGGSRFYLHSHLNLLDAEYEWFQKDGKVYFYAPGGVDPTTLTVMARVRENGLFNNSTNYVEVSDIDFFASTVEIRSDYNRIENCNIQYPQAFFNNGEQNVVIGNEEHVKFKGDEGVIIKGNGNYVGTCEIAYSLGSGIDILSGSTNSSIENCLVHDANWAGSISPAINTVGTNHTISQNTIFRCGRSGIRVYNTKASQFLKNHIYDYGKIAYDLGAIKGGHPDYQETVFAYNYYHSPDPDGHTAGGIYLDQYSGNALIHHNTSYNVKGVNLNGYAYNDRVYNNTFINPAINGDDTVAWNHYQRVSTWDYVSVYTKNNLTSNVLYKSNDSTNFDADSTDPKTTAGSQQATTVKTSGAADATVNNGDFNNVINTTISSLKVVGAEYGDFRLLSDSPAIDAGTADLSITPTKTFPASWGWQDPVLDESSLISGYNGAAPDAGAYEYGATNENGNWIAGVTWSPDWNSAPVPQISVAQDPDNSNNFTFSAENSTDAEGWIMRYDWDFGDGNKFYGKSVSHTFQSLGDFTVTLTLRDNFSASASTQVNVTVPIGFTIDKLVTQPTPTVQLTLISGNTSGDIEMYVGKFDAGVTESEWDYNFTKTGINDLSEKISVEMTDALQDGITYYARVKVIGNNGTEWSEAKTITLDRINSLPYSDKLLVHVSANDRRLQSDQNLSTWLSLSGTSYNATEIASETTTLYKANQVKGMGAVHFNDSIMKFDTPRIKSTEAITAFVVYTNKTPETDQTYQRLISVKGDIANDFNNSGWQAQVAKNGTHNPIQVTTPTVVKLAKTDVYQAYKGVIYLGTNANSFETNNYNKYTLQAEYYEVAVYEGTLSTAEQNEISAWLTAKWSTADTFPEPDADWDGDGFTNAEEAINGSDPSIANFDTDKDGASDQEEMLAGTDPNDFFDRPDFEDSDFDGLSDTLESLLNSDPLIQDSDEDGFMDRVEFEANTLLDQPLSQPVLASKIVGNSSYGFEKFDGSEFVTQDGRINGTPQSMARSSDNVEWIFEKNASVTNAREIGVGNGTNVLTLGYVSDLSGNGLTSAEGAVIIKPVINRGFGTLTFRTNAWLTSSDESTYKIKVDYFDNETATWVTLSSQIITDIDGGGQESRSITIDKNFQQADAIKITAFEVTPQHGLNNSTGVFIDDVALTSYTQNIQEPEPTPVLGLEIEQNGTVLTWSCESLIDVKAFKIIDRETGEILGTVLTTESNYYQFEIESEQDIFLVIVDNDGSEQYFTPADGNKITTVYDLKTGWNLIALKGEAVELKDLTNFTSGSLWTWNGSDYETTTNPEPNQAIWVYSETDQIVTVSSYKCPTKLSLTNGWNLVGVSENQKILVQALAVYQWNGFYRNLDLTDLLLEGQAYWIFVL